MSRKSCNQSQQYRKRDLQLTPLIQGDKAAEGGLQEQEQAIKSLEARLAQLQAAHEGREASGTGHAVPSTSTLKTDDRAHAEIFQPLDHLQAYIQITDQQRRIHDADERFRAFRRASAWGKCCVGSKYGIRKILTRPYTAHMVSSDATIAQLAASKDIGIA